MPNLVSFIMGGVNEALQLLKTEIDKNTPEDTKTLVGNNKILPAVSNGTSVGGAVINETEYAPYVEYGVGGKKYKYRKPKGSVFLKGVGARMFTKARFKNEKKVQAIIAKSFNLYIQSLNAKNARKK